MEVAFIILGEGHIFISTIKTTILIITIITYVVGEEPGHHFYEC